MGKKWMTAAATAAAVVAIAGCGGSDGDSETTAATSTSATVGQSQVADAAFRDRAEEICRQVERDLRGVRMELDTVARTKVWTGAQRAAQLRALRAYAELTPPEGTQSAYDQLLQLLDDASARVERGQLLMNAEDPGLRDYYAESNRRAIEIAERARVVGITPCWGAS